MPTTLDTVTFNMVNAQQTPPAGLSGLIDAIWATVGGAGAVQVYDGVTRTMSPLAASVGQQVTFTVRWSNRATAGNVKGHLDFAWTPPGGQPIGLTLADASYQDKVAAPGQYWQLTYNPVTLQVAGDYNGALVLSGVAA